MKVEIRQGSPIPFEEKSTAQCRALTKSHMPQPLFPSLWHEQQKQALATAMAESPGPQITPDIGAKHPVRDVPSFPYVALKP